MTRDQINFRCDQDMKIYLIKMGDYSGYIRNLIDADRARLRDKSYIDSRRRELKKQLEELDREEKVITEAPIRGREVLQRWMKIFKEDPRSSAGSWDESAALMWVRTRVLPDLKKAGVLDLQPKTILPMFMRGVIE